MAEPVAVHVNGPVAPGSPPRHFAAIYFLASPFMPLHLSARSGRWIALVAGCVFAAPLAAQQPATPAQVAPDTGAMAPDFTVPGATKDGVMSKALKLSDFRG